MKNVQYSNSNFSCNPPSFSPKQKGFFQQFFGVAPPLYNGSLAVYYFLIIRYGWKNQNPKLKIAEKLLHAIPLVYATITSVIGSALDMYRSANLWCWVSGKYAVTRMIFLYGPGM